MMAGLQAQTKAAPQPSFTPARTALLQRQCACGGTPGIDGECAACRSKRLSRQRGAQRTAETALAPPIVHEVLRSPGRPLDAATRGLLASRFGHDFGHVRVHTDARAAESARSVNALAYTVGRDIVFGSGQYRPSTASGQRLLAHEAAHVLQQRDAVPGSAPPDSLKLDSAEDEAFEREAEAASDRFRSGERVTAAGAGPAEARVSRQLDEEGAPRPESDRTRPGDPLPYREAMEQTEQGAQAEYLRNCAGIRILERLEREEISPLERVQGLERRLRVLPGLFALRRSIQQISDPQERQATLDDFQTNQVEGNFPKFPRGYALGPLEDELARAQCELSKARWEFMVFMRTGRVPGSRLLRR